MNLSSTSARPRSPISLKVVAWTVTLLVSPLVDILCFERTGFVPPWLFWGKAGLLTTLVLLGWPWKPVRPLLSYFSILLAIIAFMRLNTWALETPAWLAWQEGRSYAVVVIVAQLLEIGVALSLIGVLFQLRKRRDRFFLVRGNLQAAAEPIHLLGQKKPGPLWQFGLIFTLVVIVGQVFLFILPLALAADTWLKLLPFLPLILALAAANGFSEEISLRVAPISPLFEVVGRSNAIWMAAVFFGLAHYIGGAPSGLPGVLLTALLGWFFGKCMLDSQGFFWPWLFHAVQDILPFTFMFLSALSRG